MFLAIAVLGVLGMVFSLAVGLSTAKPRQKYYPDPIDEKRRGIGKLERFI